MPSLPVNKKDFSLINRISKSFSILIDDFKFAATLLFNVRFNIRQIYTPSFKINFSQIFNLRKVKITISPFALIANITQIINVSRVRLVLAYQEIDDFVITMSQKTPITFATQLIQQLVTIVTIKKIQFIFTATIAHFFSLGDFDPDTLLVMDSQTLGQLDQS